MDSLYIEPTNETPRIVLDREKNIFEISGKSLPEDVNTFYQPVLNWLESYFREPNQTTSLCFDLDYLNTASSKLLLSLFLILENAITAGHSVEVVWKYVEDDEDMFDVGEEYSEIIKVPFKLVPVEVE